MDVVAMENMMINGVRRNGDPLGASKDSNVRALVTMAMHLKVAAVGFATAAMAGLPEFFLK